MVMIPWVREKFAERCAKWLALRGKQSRQPSLSLSLMNNDNSDNSSNNREENPATEVTTVLLPLPINVNRRLSLELEQEEQRHNHNQQQSEQQQPHVFITSVAGEREIIVRVDNLRAETTIVNACPVPIVASSNGNHLQHHQHLSSPHNNLYSSVSIPENEPQPGAATVVTQLESSNDAYCESYDNSLVMETKVLPKNSIKSDM